MDKVRVIAYITLIYDLLCFLWILVSYCGFFFHSGRLPSTLISFPFPVPRVAPPITAQLPGHNLHLHIPLLRGFRGDRGRQEHAYISQQPPGEGGALWCGCRLDRMGAERGESCRISGATRKSVSRPAESRWEAWFTRCLDSVIHAHLFPNYYVYFVKTSNVISHFS